MLIIHVFYVTFQAARIVNLLINAKDVSHLKTLYHNHIIINVFAKMALLQPRTKQNVSNVNRRFRDVLSVVTKTFLVKSVIQIKNLYLTLSVFANAKIHHFICKKMIAYLVQTYSNLVSVATQINVLTVKKAFLTIQQLSYVSVQMKNRQIQHQADVNKKVA